MTMTSEASPFVWMKDKPQVSNEQASDRFPSIPCNVEPFGNKVLVQIMLPQEVTRGGIILSDDTQDANADTTQVAKVIALGPLAFHNQSTGEPWPEGAWVETGAFVRVPRYGGDRWKVKRDASNASKRPIEFALIKDLDLLGKITGDPTTVISYV